MAPSGEIHPPPLPLPKPDDKGAKPDEPITIEPDKPTEQVTPSHFYVLRFFVFGHSA